VSAPGDDGPYATMAFDMERRRPGCVLIQAMHGCFVRDPVRTNPASHFDPDTWIVDNPELLVYEIKTKELFDRIADTINAEARARR
jgi:hypothetical protein